MLFNSIEFIFFFLPITFAIYFLLNKLENISIAKGFLVASSLFFYSWWNVKYLPIIIVSMVINFYIGGALRKESSFLRFKGLSKKTLLVFGITCNLVLLGFFKYSDFFIENINYIFNSEFDLLHLALPLAISFFTFQQISFLVDSYKKETEEYDFVNYSVFVTFFPQLIAGPIVHHKEMIPQFLDRTNGKINFENITRGLYIFSIGLFKKVMIADFFAEYAVQGFDAAYSLSVFEAWATSLSYTFQLYFDFSGYSDMAIGLALMFNIVLPINFNSPYKALNIQDFWRRWHITLSRFLRDYVYIPLGGNRNGNFKTYNNLIATFVIGGLWHGAGWTFIAWGFLHGVAIAIHRFWKKLGFAIWKPLAWFLTFNFVNIAWVFFRAENWDDVEKVLKSMFGMDRAKPIDFSIHFVDKISMWLNTPLYNILPYNLRGQRVDEMALIYSLFFIAIVLIFKNSNRFVIKEKVTMRMTILAAFVFGISVIKSLVSSTEVFLYFNF